MRDFLLNEALKRLATEAATRFSTLVASGDQIPFDVAAEGGDDSAFYSYVPLTSRYVEERAEELRSLPSFGARPRGRGRGRRRRPLPGGARRVGARRPGRARRADADHLHRRALGGQRPASRSTASGSTSALSMLDAEARDADDAEVLIVPIVGLRMSRPRLQLPHGVRIVRADSIEAPVEAMRSEGMGRAAWEPQYLAVAEQDPDEGAEARARPAARADQRDAAVQGRRHRPRPLRLRPDRRGLLAADRHRRPRDPARRLPPQRGGGRRAGRAGARRWRPAPTPTAPSPGRSAASRWAASARARSTGSATTCWRCARCSRATARSAPRCRCAPRR